MDQIVKIPLLGGIDESIDPDQLPAPGMKELTNIVVRKKQRFQKREGYTLIPNPASSTTPANVYRGNVVSGMPFPAEAIGGHKSPSGDKLVTVADSQMFEYVGQDGLRQYRYVNDVPRAIGDVVPVDTSAGQCLEIESCIIKNENNGLRVTVWSVAARPSAIMADDSIWWENIDGAGLYFSIQNQDTGAFLFAPTRIYMPGHIATMDVRNLRVCESYEDAALGADGNVGCIIMWQQGPYSGAPQLWGIRINAYGEVGDTINVTNLLQPGYQGLPPTYRSFDIASLRRTGEVYGFALIVCTEDSKPVPELQWYQINASATVLWTVSHVTTVFDAATTGRTWKARCMRGVTMQYEKSYINGPYTVTVRVGISDPSEAGYRVPIDMALVTFLVAVVGPSYFAEPGRWGIIRGMNYQTHEDFSSVPGYAGLGAKKLMSDAVSQIHLQAAVHAGALLAPRENVATVVLPDGSKQLYTFSDQMEFTDSYSAALMAVGAVYKPGTLPDSEYATWSNLAQSRYAHQYPANLQFKVDMTSPAVYSRGRQICNVTESTCGATNLYTGAVPGYYESVSLAAVFAGVPQVIAATADIILARGILSTSIVLAAAGAGVTNGLYNNVPLNIGGNYTARANVTVAAGSVSAIIIVDSGYDYAFGAGQPITINPGLLYVGSPLLAGVATCSTDIYAAWIIIVDGGDYDNSAAPFAQIRQGACAPVAGTGSPPMPVPTAHNETATMLSYELYFNNGATYSFVDSADILNPLTSAAFAVTPQSCVHRWSSVVAPFFDGGGHEVILGVSSVGGKPATSPSGDAPLSGAYAYSTNNYFEVYKWMPGGGGETLLRPTTTSGPVSGMISALAGPWRMVGDLAVVRRPDNSVVSDTGKRRIVAAITPAGDVQQRTQFLVYVGDTSNNVTMVAPTIDEGTSSLNWRYVNNKGMFVESANAPRMLTVPLNSTRMFTAEQSSTSDGSLVFMTTSMTGGMLRDGSSENACQVGAISYDLKPSGWRQILKFADYTLVNGGIMSSFDGSSCSESCIMLWPQRDLTLIAAERQPMLMNTNYQFYNETMKMNLHACLWPQSLNTYAYGAARDVSVDAGEVGMAVLANIPRPYYVYEAGMKPGALTVSQSMPWTRISTSFGGDPTEDYQSIMVDQRMSAYSLNSAVSGDTAPGGIKALTYYGKYGKKAQIGSVYWVPRNVGGILSTANAMTQKGCFFDSLDTSCDMMMRWVYEVADGTGRIVRSAPSVPSRYSIISSISCSDKGDDFRLTTGVGEFRYGFFAPRIELTNRLRVGSDDNKRIMSQPYTTAEPYSSVFYRMPFKNWLTPATSFISDRNDGRQLCPFSSSPYEQDNPYGYVVNNLTCFDGPAKEYLGILGMPYLYTTGGEYANTCPPSVRCMTIHQSRVVIGGADDATVIWFSKEVTEQDAPSFSDLLTIQISDGGAVTGLGSLARALVVFKRSQIHVLTGDMPGSTATGASTASPWKTTLGEPHRLVDGLGCISPRSVISTPVGLFFQSNRTIEMMGQNMAVSPIGYRIMDVLETYSEVVSVVHKAVDSEVIFCCQKPSVLAGTNMDDNGSQAVLMVYNYLEDIWSKHTTSNFGRGNVAIGEQNEQTLMAVGGRTYRTNDTRFYDKTPNGNIWVTASGETAPIALNQGQGFQRVKRIRIMGDPIPALPAPQLYQTHGMVLSVMTDWDSTQLSSWTEAQAQSIYSLQGREFFEIHVRNQKCQKISLRFEDIQGSTLNTGYGVAFSSIALVVGVKSGLNKRMTMIAEH